MLRVGFRKNFPVCLAGLRFVDTRSTRVRPSHCCWSKSCPNSGDSRTRRPLLLHGVMARHLEAIARRRRSLSDRGNKMDALLGRLGPFISCCESPTNNLQFLELGQPESANSKCVFRLPTPGSAHRVRLLSRYRRVVLFLSLCNLFGALCPGENTPER